MQDDSEPQEQLDAIEELTRSDGYKLVAQRIVSVVESKREALEGEGMISRPDAANYARGYIAGMKLCLTIPTILQSEIHDELKQQVRKAR